MGAGYRWKPIEDLPSDPHSLTDGELDALRQVWIDQRQMLEQDPSGLRQFDEQLQREWAIETGIIERVYTLDRGVTETLIRRGIDAALIPHDATDKHPDWVARVIQDHADALDGLFAFVKGDRPLGTSYVKELHVALLRHQDTFTVVDPHGKLFEKQLHKGQYKTLPNNPTRPDASIHEYCPPEHVAAEMDRLIALHLEHASGGVPPEVEAAWLHHAFAQIHPFEDGNGRVARALASLILIRAELLPLVIARDDREAYLDALEAADRADLHDLVALFVKVQRKYLIQAGEAISEIRPPKTVEEQIAAARDKLIQKRQITPRQWQEAKQTALRLLNVAITRFNTTASRLTAEIGSVGKEFQFQAGTGRGEYPEVAKVVGKAHYQPNLTEFHHFLSLKLHTAQKAQIIISFHGLGIPYRGLVAVASLFVVEGSEPQLVSDEVFQINYQEDESKARQRFEPWLDKRLAEALNLWRESL